MLYYWLNILYQDLFELKIQTIAIFSCKSKYWLFFLVSFNTEDIKILMLIKAIQLLIKGNNARLWLDLCLWESQGLFMVFVLLEEWIICCESSAWHTWVCFKSRKGRELHCCVESTKEANGLDTVQSIRFDVECGQMGGHFPLGKKNTSPTASARYSLFSMLKINMYWSHTKFSPT